MEGSLDQPPIVIRPPKAMDLAFLGLFGFTVWGGIWMVRAGYPGGYLASAACLVATLVFAVRLLWAGSLTLAPEGVTWTRYHRRGHIAWKDMPAGAGAEKVLPKGWILSPAALDTLLNQAKARWS